MPITCQRGVVVAGRYELARLLGEGGMGEVWAAVHVVTRKAVALKFLKGSGREEERRRFMREARAASVVRHPCVVQVHDILEEAGTPVLVMDLLTGMTLATRLAQKGALPLGEVAKILVPVISAVGTAHALGIIHRDLKPENIFLCDTLDGSYDVKVLDFGVAKLTATEGDAAQTAGLTRTGEILGTPYYMSPEQVFGEADIDHRADIWSIGVILYECLAGVRPFEGDNVGQILKKVMVGGRQLLERTAPGMPLDVCVLVNRMLSTERSERPADLREVLDVLRQHTDSVVPSFGVARAPAVIVPSGVTPASGNTDPFSKTTLNTPAPGGAPQPTTVSPSRPKAWWVALGILFAVGAAAGAWHLAKRSNGNANNTNPVNIPIHINPNNPQNNPPNINPTLPIAANPSVTPVAAAPGNDAKTDTPKIADGRADAKAEIKADAKADAKHRHGKPAKAPAAQPNSKNPPPAKLPGGVTGDVPF